MQPLPIYLYNNLYDVILDLNPTVIGANRVMYQRDLNIQKGFKNQVRIQFKNSDQKKIRVFSTQTYVFSMYDSLNQQLILEKPLEILDVATTATRGLAQLTLTESDTADLLKSNYKFSIKCLNSDGSYSPAFSNTYYGITGNLSLSDDAFPVLKPSSSISTFSQLYNASTLLYEFNSGNIYANPEYNGNSALHTLAFYLTGYRGTVLVQGTLENSPGSGNHYATLITKTYNQFTGIDHINFNGVYTYIKIIHIPNKGPGDIDNLNSAYSGTFDKLLYRS